MASTPWEAGLLGISSGPRGRGVAWWSSRRCRPESSGTRGECSARTGRGRRSSSRGSRLFLDSSCVTLHLWSGLLCFRQDSFLVSFGTLCSTPTASIVVSQTEIETIHFINFNFMYKFEGMLSFKMTQELKFHVRLWIIVILMGSHVSGVHRTN